MSETIHQSIYKDPHPPITVTFVQLGTLSDKVIQQFLSTADNTIGVAASYGSKCIMDAIAFATSSNVLLVYVGKKANKKKHGKSLLRDLILCAPSLQQYGFYMDRIASSLHIDVGVPIQNAFDLQHHKHARNSIAAILDLLSADGTYETCRESILNLFGDENASSQKTLSLRAWANHKIALRSKMRIVPPFDTKTLEPQTLQFLAKSVRDFYSLDALKPHKVKNEAVLQEDGKDGAINLQCSRFKTRLRKSGKNQTIVFETPNGNVSGRAVLVRGKTAKVSVSKKVDGGTIRSITTVGKEDLTCAESQRSTIVLNAFQGSANLLSSPFVQSIFFPPLPANKLKWPEPPLGPTPTIDFPCRPLNDSQRKAVDFCLSMEKETRIGLIVGPPGTGKTTVIAAAVTSIINGTKDETVWIVAQSNVAVKNVAEKLVDSSFVNFFLLVSNEFHFEWHEHLYHQIEQKVIKSSEFPKNIVDTERCLRGSRVILCTMSMLCNQTMLSAGFTRVVPIRTVIVDEASQIEVGEYLPMLSRLQSSLQKLVFIGDDKQLPPYGQEDIGNLRSVFEIPHLKKRALFLDTQYRMPQAIGDFISHHVYDKKLKTVHEGFRILCCRFVDVSGGVETKGRGGTSYMNIAEVNVIVNIARRYQDEGKKFRIVTAYDAQRNAIETALRSEGLKWEDKCFNVDSFQGNEDDHIILSLVRSDKPGFMRNERRVNVMLTRCKQSMLICSSKRFLRGPNVKSSLLGKLAEEWTAKSASSWITVQQINTRHW